MTSHTHGTIVFMPPGPLRVGMPSSELRVSVPYAMPVELTGWLKIAECDTELGPRCGLEAHLTFSALGAQLILRGQPRGGAVAKARETAFVSILPPGERMSMRPAPVRGAAGQPRLSLRLVDSSHATLSDPVDMACIAGTHALTSRFHVPVEVAIWLSAREETGHEGIRLRLNSELVFTRGVTGNLAFHPRPLGAAPSLEIVEVPLVRPGQTFSARERSITVNPGRGPWISMRFIDADGRTIDREKAVGRCMHS